MSRSVYIIGGGSSLRNFDFRKLKGLDTIAVNMAALDVPDPTYCITADSGIFHKLQQGTFKQVKTTWVVVTNPDHCSMQFKNGQFIHRKTGFVYNPFCANILIRNAGTDGFGLTFNEFCTGYNSGFCAMQLAYLLGYDEIYLMGIDLCSGTQCHYHDRYNGRKIDEVTFRTYRRCFFEAIDYLHKHTKVHIYNCSRNSALAKVLGFTPFDDTQSQPEEVPDMPKIQIPPETKVYRKGEGPFRLSLLICTIPERKFWLGRLLESLKYQQTPEVEIIVEKDNVDMSTGDKRNMLLKEAKGDYIAFIDDDDEVSPDYIAKTLTALQSNPDCCSLNGMLHKHWNGQIIRENPFFHSLKYKKWFERGGAYYRNPNHLNAVKRELALQVLFPGINDGEDKDYSMRLLPLLKTEARIDGVIYHYLAGR